MTRQLRSIGKMEIWEPPDKTFAKHTISEGTGDQPNEGSICVIGITVLGDADLSGEELGGYSVKDRLEVTIGEGDCRLANLFDNVLLSMKAGEACYVKSKSDVQGNKLDDVVLKEKGFKFNMFLESFQPAADLEKMNADERLERAQHHKNVGTELFKKDNLSYAMKRYERALVCLEGKGEEKLLPGELPLQHKTLILQCHLNLAAAYLKQENYEQVVEHCTQGLTFDPKSVKGLFRRGQAYMKMQKSTEARQDFVTVTEIEPGNKAAKGQIVAIDDNVKKEKQMYAKMFG